MPDIYNIAHAHLGTPKNEIWVFEDSIIALETAVRTGFPTVGIYNPNSFELERVREIATIFIDKDETMLTLKSRI